MIDLPVLEQACAVFVELARKSAFLLLAAFAISRGLRGFSASWRHLLWLITFASLLVLPVLILALPRQEVRFTKLSWMTEIEREVGSFQQDLLYGPGPGPVREAASSGDRKPAEATWPGSLGSLLAAIWALGALGFGGHLLIQYVRIGLALPRWTPLAEGGWVPDLEILKNQLGIRQSIRTVYSPETDVPLIYGFRHAVLILPLDFLCWPQERRNMVLRHELLHIRAYDHLVQFATKLVCALYWFNPLVWKAGQRALIERECVCDDKVVSSGIDAGRYARALLAIAQGLCPLSRYARLVPGMVRPSELKIRIQALLEMRDHRQLTGRWALACLLAGGLGVSLLASLQLSPASAAAERFRLFYAAYEHSQPLDIFVDGRRVLSQVKGHMGETWTTADFSLLPGSHLFEVRLSSDPEKLLARRRVKVDSGRPYLAFLLGKPERLSLRIVEDDPVLPGQGRQKVRIVHGAPGAGDFSVAIRALDLQGKKPGKELFRTPELSFGEISSYEEFESDPWFAIEQYIDGRKSPMTHHLMTQDGAITIIVLNHLFGPRS